jgi:pyruvate/2-oxoglutarate dehydrogenase complex dihydrolipoamide dehydrogenase (E3) component
MRLAQLPRRLAIVGGGFVTAELGHFFRELGTEVTIIARGDGLLNDEDHDIAARFTGVFERRFDLRLRTEIKSARRDGDDTVLELDGPAAAGKEPGELRVDALLVATGRVPNTDVLGAREAGIELDEAGFVKTDEFLHTSAEGVWALGDLVGEYLLKHSANLEAAHVAHNLLNPNELVAVDYHAMPHAVFASPQIGSVGVTEREAKESGRPFVVGSYEYDDTAYGSSIEDHDGFVKVLADPETREILGVHILGVDASTLIQGPATLMRTRAKVDVIQRAIFVHPALPEVIQRAFGQLEL